MLHTIIRQSVAQSRHYSYPAEQAQETPEKSYYDNRTSRWKIFKLPYGQYEKECSGVVS